MPLNAAALQDGGAAIATAIVFLSLHTDTPDAGGSNESSAPRVAAGLTSVGGVISTASKAFTGGASSGPCKFVGFWSASTGGTFLGSAALAGDQAFNAAGQYTVDAMTLTGSAT